MLCSGLLEEWGSEVQKATPSSSPPELLCWTYLGVTIWTYFFLWVGLLLSFILSSFFFFFCSFHFKLYYGQPLTAMITIKMVRFVLLVLLEGFSSSTLCVSFFLKAPVVPAPAQLEHLELILGLPGLSPTLVFEVCVLPRLKPISPPLKVSAGWY